VEHDHALDVVRRIDRAIRIRRERRIFETSGPAAALSTLSIAGWPGGSALPLMAMWGFAMSTFACGLALWGLP